MATQDLVKLGADFAGTVLQPGDAGYDEARSVFNAMIDRRPAVIARCASTADVVAAVRFARANDLRIAVRCGGHSVAGFSVCDAGMLIDLSGLKSVDIDPATRIARTGGGVLWGEFDAATQAHGLHTPGGRITTTGIGGFTTGGGYGWTSSKYGLACDNLVSAEVVLADGSVVSASETRNADLFWGIRGGGGNFGIVTRFDFRLHPLGPIVLAGLLMWPLDRLGDVLTAWRDYADAAPDEVGTAFAMLTAPPEPFVPAELQGRTVAGIAFIHVGDPEVGASLVQPLKNLAPAVDIVQPMPYTAFQAALDASAPKGLRHYWRGEYLAQLPDDALRLLADGAPELVEVGVPFSQVIVFRIGQGVSATPDDATAFSHRDAAYLFHPISAWTDPADDARIAATNRALSERMRPFGSGAAYLNFTPEGNRVREAYGERKYERLVAIKDTYDPDNVFRFNQNVVPSRLAAEPANGAQRSGGDGRADQEVRR